jgi:cytochrome c biogenesis protein CcmG/thiol:disulfide interchange protein DsbE
MHHRFYFPSLALLPVIALINLLLSSCVSDKAVTAQNILSTPLPEFGIAMVTIPEGTVSDWDFKHQLSLFNAYSSSCVPCLAEHRLLMRIAQQDDYQIIGLNWQDTRVAAIHWLRSHGDPYNRSAFDDDGELAQLLDITGVPQTLLVDGNGIIRYRHIGPITESVWQSQLLPILKKLDRNKP